MDGGKAGKAARRIGSVPVVAGQVVEAVVKVVVDVMGVDKDSRVEVGSTAQQNRTQHKTTQNNIALSQHITTTSHQPMLAEIFGNIIGGQNRNNCGIAVEVMA